MVVEIMNDIKVLIC